MFKPWQGGKQGGKRKHVEFGDLSNNHGSTVTKVSPKGNCDPIVWLIVVISPRVDNPSREMLNV